MLAFRGHDQTELWTPPQSPTPVPWLWLWPAPANCTNKILSRFEEIATGELPLLHPFSLVPALFVWNSGQSCCHCYQDKLLGEPNQYFVFMVPLRGPEIPVDWYRPLSVTFFFFCHVHVICLFAFVALLPLLLLAVFLVGPVACLCVKSMILGLIRNFFLVCSRFISPLRYFYILCF